MNAPNDLERKKNGKQIKKKYKFCLFRIHSKQPQNKNMGLKAFKQC